MLNQKRIFPQQPGTPDCIEIVYAHRNPFVPVIRVPWIGSRIADIGTATQTVHKVHGRIVAFGVACLANDNLAQLCRLRAQAHIIYIERVCPQYDLSRRVALRCHFQRPCFLRHNKLENAIGIGNSTRLCT